MKTNPLVSVLVPVYNVAPFIEKCVKSIFEQTYDNLEIIFVDDCSTDQSIQIVQEVVQYYSNRVAQIKIVRHEKNRGQAAGRNTALSVANGDFLMFVDSDDWIEPDSVELLLHKQEESDADIVYGQLVMHYSTHDEVVMEPMYANKTEMVLRATELTIDHTLCKRIFRRSLFTENNLHCCEGLDYGEDHYLMPQLLWFAQRVERIEKVLYHYNYWKENAPSPPLNTVHKMWSNELTIIDLLMNFFDGKSTEVVESLKHTKVIYLMSSLGKAYAHGTRRKYNEIASMLYAMPEPYLSKAQFNSADERLLYRFYDSRLVYRGMMKALAKIYAILGVNH